MIVSSTTLIVGGQCRRLDGRMLVQKRSWKMIRIFSDHMAKPVFAMHEAPMDDTLAYELPHGVKIVRLPIEGAVGRMTKSIGNVPMTNAIEGLLDEGCVVYLRMPNWACWRVFNRAMSKGNRIFASLHGDWADDYRHKKGSLATRIASFMTAYYVDRAYKLISLRSDILFCTGRRLHEQYGRYATQNVVIANFLHSEEDIRTSERRVVAPPYQILFVGHLEERKGLIYLLRSVALLANEGVTTRLTIVGEGPLRGILLQSATELGIAANVDFIDYIQHGEELYTQYRKADVFVLPSISSEGVPKVLMEAMSQGVPVVATDVGSSRNLIGESKRGLVVPPQDEKRLAKAIKMLIVENTLRNRFITNGLELARKSTCNVQRTKVKEALQSTVPEILGIPEYLERDFRAQGLR